LSLIVAGVLSAAEIRTLLARLVLHPIAKLTFVIAWSRWRRHHQARAAQAHYRSRKHSQL
jgi:hypothetical protein